MATNERLTDALEPVADVLVRREDVDRARRVERGLDGQGRPILDGRDYIPLRSPDGSVWRIRISNTGVLSAKKEPS